MIDFYKYVPKGKRLKNLLTLAEFLDRQLPPPQFDMTGFVVVDGTHTDYFKEALLEFSEHSGEEKDIKKMYAHCDTAACAVGHGPLAGIKIKKDESWSEYSYRVFVKKDDDDINRSVWDFLFAGEWSEYDNTPGGAAARIRYLIVEHKVPDYFDDETLSLYKKYLKKDLFSS